MKRSSPLLSFLLVGACGGALVLPLVWFNEAQELPPLGSRAEVEDALGRTVKLAREADQLGARGLDQGRFVPSAEPAFLPPEAISEWVRKAQTSWDGCPDYFVTDKEGGVGFGVRLAGFAASGSLGAPGPGRCQLLYAERIALTLGIPEGLPRVVAASRIHTALTRDELLSTYLSVVFYGPGTYGAADGARRLFAREVGSLDPARSAELRLAQSFFGDVWECRNPERLKAQRDKLLTQLESFALISEPEAKSARKQRLSCEAGEGTRRSR